MSSGSSEDQEHFLHRPRKVPRQSRWSSVGQQLRARFGGFRWDDQVGQSYRTDQGDAEAASVNRERPVNGRPASPRRHTWRGTGLHGTFLTVSDPQRWSTRKGRHQTSPPGPDPPDPRSLWSRALLRYPTLTGETTLDTSFLDTGHFRTSVRETGHLCRFPTAPGEL